jgi:hypothetical protein
MRPLVPRAVDVQNAVHNLPHFPLAMATTVIGREELCQQCPFVRLKVGRVSVSDLLTVAPLAKLHTL